MQYNGHYLFKGSSDLYIDINVQWDPRYMCYDVTWRRSARRAMETGLSQTISAQRTTETVQRLIADHEWTRKYPDYVTLPIGA